MNNFIIALIRTWVPVGVGYLVTWGLLPSTMSDQAALAFGAIITALYYLLARVLEQRWSFFGWLLGTPRTPTYPKP